MLTPEIRAIGRRNFLKASGGVAALAAWGGATVWRGPRRGGPVRTAIVGYGRQGRDLHRCAPPEVMEVVALGDIRFDTAVKASEEKLRRYADWRRLLESEPVEAVVIATPPSSHAEIALGCLAAGKHVLCETPLALDAQQCRQLEAAARKAGRRLAVGYHERHQPLYRAACQNVFQQGLLGDVYTWTASRHRAGSGRVMPEAVPATLDVSRWGYGSVDELINWRLVRRLSGGPMLEWGGAVVSILDWFLGAGPVAVQASGGTYSYSDGRDVEDHLYATLEYATGQTATVSLVESNGLEGTSVELLGTKGTLILTGGEALLFSEGDRRPVSLTASRSDASQPMLEASASRAPGRTGGDAAIEGAVPNAEALRVEIESFCGAVRTGQVGSEEVERASRVLATCSAVAEAVQERRRAAPGLSARAEGAAC
jgi:predicted dehydrogenase